MTGRKREAGPLDGAAVALFWGGLLAGLLLPVVAQVLAKRQSLPDVFVKYGESFTGAEPGLVIMVALHAAPFLVYAVFCLLHLGLTPHHPATIPARRLGGVLVAGLLMIAVSLWGNISIFASRSSTAAIGLLFLPVYLLIAAGVGYGLGRWLVSRTRHD